MATLRQYKKDYLISKGFTNKEATELTSPYIIIDGKKREHKPYSMKELRTVPYLVNMIRSRQLYVSNLRKKGYTKRQIEGLIANQYYKQDWLSPKNKLDPWKMLRKFRKQVIESGDYIPPKTSHHGEGVSKGDIMGQKSRHKESNQQKIDNLTAQINTATDKDTRDWLINLREKLRRNK
jgi:hypothetical protein